MHYLFIRETTKNIGKNKSLVDIISWLRQALLTFFNLKVNKLL